VIIHVIPVKMHHIVHNVKITIILIHKINAKVYKNNDKLIYKACLNVL